MKRPVYLVLSLIIFCLPLTSFSHQVILPIRLEGKFILIEGRVEDRSGYFVLDTGASGLILNARYFKGRNAGIQAAYGANGNPAQIQSLYVRFQLGDEVWKDQAATLIPLDYLENAKKTEILGLAGGDLFWKYEMLIDFSRMELYLQRADKGMISLIHANDFEVFLPLKFKGGMPCFEGFAGDRTYVFGLDTAAEDNLMDRDNWEELGSWLLYKKMRSFRGISRSITQVKAAHVAKVRIGDYACVPMSTLFADLSEINRNFTGQKIDGILGFELLRQYRVAINFREKTIAMASYRASLIWGIIAATDQPDSIFQRQSVEPVLLPPHHDRKH